MILLPAVKILKTHKIKKKKMTHLSALDANVNGRKVGFVVKHDLHNIQLYFCLNCTDWIKDNKSSYGRLVTS